MRCINSSLSPDGRLLSLSAISILVFGRFKLAWRHFHGRTYISFALGFLPSKYIWSTTLRKPCCHVHCQTLLYDVEAAATSTTVDITTHGYYHVSRFTNIVRREKMSGSALDLVCSNLCEVFDRQSSVYRTPAVLLVVRARTSVLFQLILQQADCFIRVGDVRPQHHC